MFLLDFENGIGYGAMVNQNSEHNYTTRLPERIFGAAAESPQIRGQKAIPATLYRAARTELHGPFSFQKLLAMPSFIFPHTMGIPTYTGQPQGEPKGRLTQVYGDYLPLTTPDLILTVLTLLSIIIGLIVSLATLIGSGIIGTFRTRRKGSAAPKTRAPRILAALIFLLFFGNLVWLIANLYEFLPAHLLRWHFVVFAVLTVTAIFCLIQLSRCTAKAKADPTVVRTKWERFLTFMSVYGMVFLIFFYFYCDLFRIDLL